MNETRKRILFFGPVVWGGVWGHGPELASLLAGDYRLDYLDPIVPAGALKPSFRDNGNYGNPDAINLVRRTSRLRAGLLYGIMMEFRNLLAVARLKPSHLVTYYPLGCILALTWAKLTGINSLFVYADFPDIFRNRLFAGLARSVGIKLTAKLTSRGTVATSRILYEDIGEYSGRRYHVPNGVKIERPESLSSDGSSPAKDSGKGLRVCFVGYFGEWLDIGEIALDAARSRKDDSFVIVGDGPEMERLKDLQPGLPNLTLTGSVGHEKIFGLISQADVCIIPFVINRITDRVCPVKLFEYWSCGKPVVASATKELKHIAENSGSALLLYQQKGGMTEVLNKLAGDRNFLLESGETALEKVKKYDWRILAGKIKSILEGSYSETMK